MVGKTYTKESKQPTNFLPPFPPPLPPRLPPPPSLPPLVLPVDINEYVGDADAYGTIADLYTSLGDFEKAALFYDQYI